MNLIINQWNKKLPRQFLFINEFNIAHVKLPLDYRKYRCISGTFKPPFLEENMWRATYIGYST